MAGCPPARAARGTLSGELPPDVVGGALTDSESPLNASDTSWRARWRVARWGLLAALGAALAAAPTLWLPGRLPAGFDASTQVLPLLRLAARDVAAGTLPTWTDGFAQGFPLLGSYQTPLLYPLAWPLVAFDDPGVAFGAFCFVHLVLTGVGGFVLAGRFGLSRQAQVVVAVLLAGSAPVVSLANRPSFLAALALGTFTYAAVLGDRRGGGWMLAMSLGLTAGLTAEMFVAHALVAAVLWAGVRWLRGGPERSPGSGSGVAVTTTLGVLALAAPALSLFGEVLALSDRVSGHGTTTGSRFAVGFEQVLQLPSPMTLGLTPFGLALGHVGAARYAQFLWVAAPLAGTAATLCVLLALRFRRGRLLGGLVLGAFVLASPHTFPGVSTLWETPPLSLVRYTAKVWMAALPLVALTAGVGVDALRRRQRGARWLLVAGAGVGVVMLLIPPDAWQAMASAQGQSLAGANAAALGRWAGASVVVVAGCLFSATWLPAGRRGWAIAAVVAVEAVAFGHGALRTLRVAPPPTPVVAHAIHAALDAKQGVGGSVRLVHEPNAYGAAAPSSEDAVATDGAAHDDDSAALAQTAYEQDFRYGRLNHLVGEGVALDVAYTGVRLADQARLYAATRTLLPARVAALGSDALLVGGAWPAEDGFTLVERWPEADLALYGTGGRWSVRVARRLVGVGDEQALVAALRDPALDLAQDAVVLGPSAPGGPATFDHVRRQPKEVVFEVTADAPRLVWTPDVLTPAWSVTVDGAPAGPVPVHGALRGVVVPAGRHVVRWRYADDALGTGLGVSLVAVLLLALQLALQRRRRSATSSPGRAGPPEAT